MLSKMLRSGVALLAVTLLLFAACNSSDDKSATKRFVFLINVPNPYWDACKAGLVAGEKEFDLAGSGLSVSMESNDGTASGQIDKLKQFGTQTDIVGVALTVTEPDNQAIIEQLKKLQSQGIKVITVDNDVNRTKYRDARPYYIGTNNFEAGKLLGTVTKTLLNERKVEKGAYVQFAGLTDSDNARNRMDGVKAGLGSDFTERDRMADDTDLGRANDNVSNALTNHDDLVALVGIWAYNGPAISTIAKQRDARKNLTLVTFDADKNSILAMAGGNLDAMCVQNPYEMGRLSVRLLKAMHTKDQATIDELFPNFGKDPDGDLYTTPLKLVYPDEGSPLKAVAEKAAAEPAGPYKGLEFMPLSTLKDWLKKYGLPSS
ncbi:substrate-binding domain-containing protein [Anatilimnocola floriformis]|uniref:substrate-binding domain-containing protein n=1 Tax=Anatilimnocola floriformis TaxID=2948575 RepID=UPI0020C36712|nr:substrate-binding domain-containing protein [Anatilimnocola floriformis]